MSDTAPCLLATKRSAFVLPQFGSMQFGIDPDEYHFRSPQEIHASTGGAVASVFVTLEPTSWDVLKYYQRALAESERRLGDAFGEDFRQLVVFATTSGALTDKDFFLYAPRYWPQSSATGRRTNVSALVVDATTQRPTAAPAIANIRAALERLVREAHDTYFEDGIESALASDVQTLIRAHGDPAIGLVEQAIEDEQAAESVRCELLHIIGRLRDKRTSSARRMALVRQLSATSVAIRDAAVVGLSYFGEPSTAYDLRQAATRERNRELRNDMLAVARDLDLEGEGAAPNKENRSQAAVA